MKTACDNLKNAEQKNIKQLIRTQSKLIVKEDQEKKSDTMNLLQICDNIAIVKNNQMELV